VGQNDGIRSKLKAAAKAANKESQKLLKERKDLLVLYLKKEKAAELIRAEWAKKQVSITDGPKVWDAFADGKEDKKQAVRLRHPGVNIDQWVDQLAEIGIRMKLAYDDVGDTEMAAQAKKEASDAALHKESQALEALRQYVEKKKAAKALGDGEYQKFKASFMEVAKIMSA
jgi:hypothetical protein